MEGAKHFTLKIWVKKKSEPLYYKEIVGYNGPMPKITECICFNDGEMATITDIQWDFDNMTVWVICK